MKHLLSIFAVLALISCKKEEKKEALYPESMTEETSEDTVAKMTTSETLGQEIFNGKGNCHTCHKADKKVIGPSIKEITKIYAEQNGDMAAFLRGKADPIVDPSQYDVMKTNFYITKHFTDEEMQAVVDYMVHFQEK